MSWEYQVIPAPRRVPRVRGLRAVPDRFAHAVAEVMNEAGREGWEFLRADALPMEPAGGLFGGMFGSRAEVTQTLLVFRRRTDEARRATAPPQAAAAAPAPEPMFASAARPEAPSHAGRVTPLPPRAARPTEEDLSAEALGGSLTPRGPAGDGPPQGSPGGPRLGGARRD